VIIAKVSRFFHSCVLLFCFLYGNNVSLSIFSNKRIQKKMKKREQLDEREVITELVETRLLQGLLVGIEVLLLPRQPCRVTQLRPFPFNSSFSPQAICPINAQPFCPELNGNPAEGKE
jgi:hypothetical protein